MDNRFAHLMDQLKRNGISNPEECKGGGEISELPENKWQAVSGGFGQLVGFNQGFGQTSIGSFSQTYFTQRIADPIQN